MNNFLENYEQNGRNYCRSGGGEGGEEGDDGNWNGEQAGVEGEWGEENGDEGENGANQEEGEHPVGGQADEGEGGDDILRECNYSQENK